MSQQPSGAWYDVNYILHLCNEAKVKLGRLVNFDRQEILRKERIKYNSTWYARLFKKRYTELDLLKEHWVKLEVDISDYAYKRLVERIEKIEKACVFTVGNNIYLGVEDFNLLLKYQ